MPRTGTRTVILMAVAVAVTSAFAISMPAAANHVGGAPDPYFTCSASTVRATLFNGDPIPPVDPLGANLDREECAEDVGGLPDIALPADAPIIRTRTAQARTEILCADDDPNPAVTPENNELCDAGRPSFEQQVLSTANVTDTTITLGGIDIVVQAANTSARARCAATVPVLSSTSQVLGIRVGPTGLPTERVVTGEPNQVIEVPGVLRITLNELLGREGPYADDAAEGMVTRRAVHIEVLPGAPGVAPGSVADVVVAESIADFHGDVCNAEPPPGVCPAGSTPTPGGQCVITNITCPAGSTLNGQGQCINNVTTCPTGSTSLGNQCVVDRVNCPAGSARNPQGQCVVQNVQCPAGTVFNPVTLGCAEGPRGGTVFPITDRIRDLFRGSPCVGGGFGPLVGIFGTNGPDRITGTNTSDRIFALGGNDRVSGGRGDDCVEGGSGRDVLDGSNGNDFLLGGTGNDRMEGGPGRDRFSGGSGRDVLSGGQGNDRMDGAAGNDRMNGGFGNDVIRGGSGNDGISNGNGKDRVFGGSGNDTINVAIVGPAARVDCGPGRDRVRITPGRRGGPLRDRHRNCEFLYIARRIDTRR